MAETIPSEAECKRAVARMNDLLPELFDYARRKRLAVRPFNEYESLSDVWQEYPDGWESNVLGMLAAASVCGQTKTCAAFVRSIRDRLPDKEVALARGWRALPWIWSGFAVTEDLGGSRVAVLPLGERPSSWPEDVPWDRLIVYSPTVAANFHRGTSLFLGQLATVGDVFVTNGVILPFSSLEAADLLAFADFVRLASRSTPGIVEPLAGVVEHVGSLCDVIATDPLSFLRLFEFTESPRIVGRRGPWRRNASVALFPGGPEMSDPAFWDDALAGDEHEVHSSNFLDDSAALFLDGGSPAYDPVVYLSFADRRVYLFAGHDDAYDEGREALLPVVKMPQTAQVRFSMLVTVAAARILDVVDELGFLQGVFESEANLTEEEDDEDQDADNQDAGSLPTMEEAQRVIDRLVHNHNEGREETDADVAEALGVTPEIVAGLRSVLPNPDAADGDKVAEVDRMGLSPRAYHELTSRRVPAAKGALVLRTPEELRSLGSEAAGSVAATPMIRFTTWLLGTVGAGERIPATKAGYVKPSIVGDAAEAAVIASPHEQATQILAVSRDTSAKHFARLVRELQPKRELDSDEFLRNRELLESAGLIRLADRAFVVTDEGRRGLDDPVGLYHRLIVTMFRSYEWYEDDLLRSLPALRERAGFLFHALHTMCGGDEAVGMSKYEWVTMHRLTAAFTGTLPMLAEELGKPHDGEPFGLRFVVELQIFRTFVSFFGGSFGLLESRATEPENAETGPDELGRDAGPEGPLLDHTWWVRPTPLLPRVFRIGITQA